MSEAKRLTLTIHGRVQGVAFRYYTRSTAGSLGLTGWVRNRPEGTVQLVAEGPAEALDALLRWARRGPDPARVDHIEVHWSEAAGSWEGFEITG